MVADTSIEVVLGMLFLTLIKVEANVAERAYLEVIQCRRGVANYQTGADYRPE